MSLFTIVFFLFLASLFVAIVFPPFVMQSSLARVIQVREGCGDWGEVGHYSGVNFENWTKIGYFNFA